MWRGDYLYLFVHLVLKDFRVRYRNMSLGVLWSLLNPLVMMGVLTFIFTKVFTGQSIPHYPLFVLCGMVPYNFFTIAWLTGTTSVVENAGLIKRVPVPREVIPVATVLSCCIHLLVQIGLLLTMVIWFRIRFNIQWFWMPLLWAFEIVFVCGLAMFSSAVNVFIRDTRYVVESATVVLFWLVPVFYDSDFIPVQYRSIYALNPVAALVVLMRQILLHSQRPEFATLGRLAAVSIATFIVGLLFFRRMKPKFYEHI